MSKRKELTAAQLIDQINKRLDNIEELFAWLVRAEQRFRIGSRVEFSPYADRRGISRGRKGGVRTGRVVSMDEFSVGVMLDGYTRPHSFHHTFFQPTTKRKGASRK
jgi:hypothetical protein